MARRPASPPPPPPDPDDNESYLGASMRRPLRDEEFPDSEDDADDESTDTLPCPHCRKDVVEDSPWCPHCGNYLHREENMPRRSGWIGVVFIILVVATVIGMVLTR